MIQVAAILVAVVVIWDACIVALDDVKFQRQRVDRRWKR